MSQELKEFIQARPELADMPQEEVQYLLEDYRSCMHNDQDADESNTDWEL